MPDTDSLTIVQKFTYRGRREEFSNTYHLSGTTPTTEAGWKAVADDLWTRLALIYDGAVSMVRAYGYEAGSNHANAVVDYEAAPLTPPTGSMTWIGVAAPGDAAMMCSWWDGAYNSRGKKIYLRKYFHGCHHEPDNPDALSANQLVHLQAFADDLLANPVHGDLRLVSPQGASPVNAHASPWITTRTLKRRGRRPPG